MTRQHHTARLRLRFSALKRDRALAACVAHALRRLPGVQAVEVSPVTGSMLVQLSQIASHDPHAWTHIHRVVAQHGLHRTEDSHASPTWMANFMAQQLTDALIQRLLGGSAAALLVALL